MTRALTILITAMLAGPATAQTWLKDERGGCAVWLADPLPGAAVAWSGVCDAGGRAGGRGVMELRAGDAGYRYEGEYRDGKRNGAGALTWPNGDRYEGEWRDDRQNGQGALAWANGNRYEGEWRDGAQSGRGVFTWRAGHRYEGELKDNQPHGQGVFVAKNGNRYEGMFRDGRPDGHGKGVLGGKIYAGLWTAGCIKDGEKKVAFFRAAAECP